MELSALDAQDEQIIAQFYAEGSLKCCNNDCRKLIPKNLAVNHRLAFAEMTKAEQDSIILAHLQQSRRILPLAAAYVQQDKKSRIRFTSDSMVRKDVQYMFCQILVCRTMYFFLHDIGKYRFESLCRHFDSNGIVPRVHKSANKTPARNNVLSPAAIEEIVQFIKSFADNFGLPLPGRLPQFKNFDVIKLPSHETKNSIFRKYCDLISTRENPRIIDRTTFSKIWKQYCPYIVIMKPADDLCGTCRTNQLEINRCSNVNAEAKLLKLNAATEHLTNAQKQREYYNSWRKLAENTKTYNVGGVKKTFAVISFDFAENLNCPFQAQQIGPIYFKTPRKCGLFGVHNEATHHQTHYLIDEADNIGKGANTTISLLHHYLESKENVDILVLFADNCVGQNKNNAALQYLLWRVMTGKNEKILYNFLVSGHTKFSPDRGFGMLKKKYATSTIDSLHDLAVCVNSSSPKGLQKAVITYDPSTNEHHVIWSNWTDYLQQLFKKMPGLTQHHHFIFTSDGLVRTKAYADSDEQCCYLEKPDWSLDAALIIEDIVSDGLPLERQWYLYENIRQFIIDENKKDHVAPKPVLPKPVPQKSVEEASGPSTSQQVKTDSTNRSVQDVCNTPRRGRPRKRSPPASCSKILSKRGGRGGSVK